MFSQAGAANLEALRALNCWEFRERGRARSRHGNLYRQRL